jgi:hypothetical protein
MKLPPGFWKKKEEEKCFICDSPLDKKSGEIVYKYQDGEGKVKLCGPCMDKVEEKQDEQAI